jgi:hypothetical protein
MMKNDIQFMLPDHNGVRVCELALRELSLFAVTLIDEHETLTAAGYDFLSLSSHLLF